MSTPLSTATVTGWRSASSNPQTSTGRLCGAVPRSAPAMRPSDSPSAMNGSARPPVGRNGRLTAATASEPASAASTISAVSIEIRSWASRVWAPRWGVDTTLLWRTSRRSFGGSSAKTSSAAPPIWPDSSASSSASSSITPPRPQLTISAPFFIFARRSRFSRLRVSLVSGVWKVITSGAGEQVVDRQQLDVQLAGRRGVEEGVVGHDLHLEAAGAVRHPLADAAEADDPERLALQLDAGDLAVPAPPPASRRRPRAPGGRARGGARRCARWPTSGWPWAR